MILFLSNIQVNVDFDFKQIKIDNNLKLNSFLKNNSRNLEKFDFIIIDESILDKDTLESFIKKFNKIIVYSDNIDNKFEYEYCIYKNDNKPFERQLKHIQLNFGKNLKVYDSLENKNIVEDKSETLKQDNTIDIKDKSIKDDKVDNNTNNGSVEDISSDKSKDFIKDDNNDETKNDKPDNKFSLLEAFNNLDKEITNEDKEKEIANQDKDKEIINQDKNESKHKYNENDMFADKRKNNIEKIKNSKKRNLEKKDNKKNIKDEESEDNYYEVNRPAKVEHNIEEINKNKQEIDKIVSKFDNHSHIKEEDLNIILNKQYTPSNENDDIYKINNIDTQDKGNSNRKIKFDIGAITSFKKKEKIHNNKAETIISNIERGEIAIAGGLKSVGTTYCAFKIAQQMKNLSIGYFQYDEDDIEISMLKEIQEKGYISDNIKIYREKDKLQAYQQNDIVIVDYGYLDKKDKQLLLDFERANQRYIVVNSKFNKIMSINSAIRYSEQSSGFKTIFNMTDSRELISLQKQYNYLDVLCFEYDCME